MLPYRKSKMFSMQKPSELQGMHDQQLQRHRVQIFSASDDPNHLTGNRGKYVVHQGHSCQRKDSSCPTVNIEVDHHPSGNQSSLYRLTSDAQGGHTLSIFFPPIS